MNRQDVKRTITEYLKPIFGFALKRCRSIQDAEDLSQEIAARAFRALLKKQDVEDMGKFIWTVAHHALSNYYRDSARGMVGVSLDEVAELIADPHSLSGGNEEGEMAIERLQREIAYLSGQQRRIVIAYYFENRRQAEISRELGIPLCTVKWHLFEAKRELKRGMDTMRTTSELKFHPISFHSYGVNGSVGSKSPGEFFRSALSQNICYCVRNEAKSVNQIADDLGVSPVYVESEVNFLEEYGFLRARKDKYIVDFLISEPTVELLTMQNEMYRQAAGLFANELYDQLISSGILEDPGILCRQGDCPADRNFILWSLIPFIAAWSGENLMKERIPFEEVATIRPDGAHNIYHASVVPDGMVLPEDYVYMKNWCGPMWNDLNGRMLWQIDSEWSDRGERHGMQYSQDARRVLSLYERSKQEPLSRDEYAWLAEQGYVRTRAGENGGVQADWQVVILADRQIQQSLLAIGERIKERRQGEFEALKAPYVQAVLRSVPAHLKRVKEYELQFVFHADGWFLLHCITGLLKDGRLKLPAEGQRRALTTLIAYR